MTTKSVAVIDPGKTLARRNNNSTPAKLMATGLALTRETLSDGVVQHFIVADDCSNALGNRRRWLSFISVTAPADEVEQAKAHYRSALRYAEQADKAASFLGELRDPFEPITRAQASAMLHVLFGSMGKRRDEGAMVKLSACADIFAPTDSALGKALNLWPPVPMSPTTLALAIKQLRASKTFEPSEAELREALAKVAKECGRLERAASEWLSRLRESDPLMFKTDPDGWRAAHADNNAIAIMMDNGDDAYLEALEAMFDEKFDDNGNPRAKPAALAAEQTRLEAKDA